MIFSTACLFLLMSCSNMTGECDIRFDWGLTLDNVDDLVSGRMKVSSLSSG